MRPSFNWIYGACNVGADEFGIAEGVEEAVMEDEVIAEGVDSGDGGEFSIGEIEAGAEGIAEGGGGGLEEVGEEVASGGEVAGTKSVHKNIFYAERLFGGGEGQERRRD